MRRKYLVLRNRCPNISAFPVNGFWSTLYSSLMSYIIHKYMCVIPKRQLFTIILNEKKYLVLRNRCPNIPPLL